MIEIDALPQLRDPVMVVALAGWVDAGLAGGGAVALLQEQLESARTFARLDLADLMDLQQTRPTVHLVDGVSRRDRVAGDHVERRAARARRRAVRRARAVAALAGGAR